MPAAPRIVFFGMPHTGKTGLLHAFADPEAPFPLSKYGDEKPADLCRTLPDGTVLCDVDGRSAKEILVDPRQIERDERTANDVRDSDAIVLALDASATGDATIELFHSFAAFLEGLEGARSKNREVGGLPVFLTLTKCDRLVQPDDDPNAWLRRVNAKKRSVQTAFEDYLAATGHGLHADPFAFGSIEVHVAATALRNSAKTVRPRPGRTAGGPIVLAGSCAGPSRDRAAWWARWPSRSRRCSRSRHRPMKTGSEGEFEHTKSEKDRRRCGSRTGNSRRTARNYGRFETMTLSRLCPKNTVHISMKG